METQLIKRIVAAGIIAQVIGLLTIIGTIVTRIFLITQFDSALNTLSIIWSVIFVAAGIVVYIIGGKIREENSETVGRSLQILTYTSGAAILLLAGYSVATEGRTALSIILPGILFVGSLIGNESLKRLNSNRDTIVAPTPPPSAETIRMESQNLLQKRVWDIGRGIELFGLYTTIGGIVFAFMVHYESPELAILFVPILLPTYILSVMYLFIGWRIRKTDPITAKSKLVTISIITFVTLVINVLLTKSSIGVLPVFILMHSVNAIITINRFERGETLTDGLENKKVSIPRMIVLALFILAAIKLFIETFISQ